MKEELPPIPTKIKVLQIVIAAVVSAIGMDIITDIVWLKALIFIVAFTLIYAAIGIIYFLTIRKKN